MNEELRPLIGIVPQMDVDNRFRHLRVFPHYMKALEKLGAVGVMLPMTEDPALMKELASRFDGFLFPGGNDLQPELYGEKTEKGLEETKYAPERDQFESAFYPFVYEADKPVLAVCRGMQLVNVLGGGSMIQDLPVEGEDEGFVLHAEWERPEELVHELTLVPGTLLADLYEEETIGVNSLHHQGIDRLGDGLTVSGRSKDGLVEAYDIDGLSFGMGVQWHPEVTYLAGLDDGRIFKAFIAAAKDEQKKNAVKKSS